MPARARLARGRPGEAVLTRGPLFPSYPPPEHPNSTRSRAGAPAPGGVVPSERQWVMHRPRRDVERDPRTVGVPPVARLPPAGSCHSAIDGAAAQGACAACAALARPWRGGLHHARSPITTVPHRSASSGRRVASALIAGSEIERALLCAAAQGTLPASGRARCARCARRDGLRAPLGSPAPSRVPPRPTNASRPR